jgi:cytochrome c oxidase assembly protein subunit 15
VDAVPNNPRSFVVAESASGQRLLRLLATLGIALVLVVIVSSAYLRLTQAGLSCADWPACYGRVTAHTADGVTATQITARFAHRVAAGAVGAVLIALLLIAATQYPRRKPQTALAVAGLLVTVGLATIGAVLSESAARVPLPAVTLANLAGGFALLALLAWVRLTTPPRAAMPAQSGWVKSLAALALLALCVQIMLGALVSARFAALACPAFPLCGAEVSDGALRSILDPFAELVVDANGAIVRPPGLSALHWAHRVGALIVLGFAGLLAFSLIRAGSGARRLGAIVAALIVLQLALGAGAVLAQLPLVLVLGHNFVAALLLVALITANWRVHGTDTT